MSSPTPRPLSVLTIAGSDSGGGAGIQADLKTFAAHGLHGLSAFAALTAQNTRGVTAVHVPPVDFLRAQIDACFDDFRIGAVKLGMLANRQVIDAVADALEHHRPAFVVLDPVMVATSGARLLEPDALDALRTRLFPLATIVTPNIPEAELLLGKRIEDDAAAEAAVDELRELFVLRQAQDERGAAGVVRKAQDEREAAGVLRQAKDERGAAGVLRQAQDEREAAGVLRQDRDERPALFALRQAQGERGAAFVLRQAQDERVAQAVLLKGGHLPGAGAMVDRYSDGARRLQFTHERIDVEGHGTGCTLASAIAANLCLGMALDAACEAATDYVHGALRHASRPGRGQVAVLNHFWRQRRSD